MIEASTNSADLLRNLNRRMMQVASSYAHISAQKRKDKGTNWRSAGALWPDLTQDR